ncbi:RibD family protein [Paraliomyxa miuraensis]|uniref:RibD family protein n=1 Tax=Paraliomyxa miuraensis TaxID=376150 RepID=UPI00224CCDEE|nr:RibD family protein [Paraliomyxa miuraensis]MCX4241734.1 RibD family protein [Paraliomyxa miuraensis]
MSPLDPNRALEHAWLLVLATLERVRSHGPFQRPTGVRLGDDRRLLEVELERAWIVLDPHAERGWSWPGHEPPAGTDAAALARLLDLYLPLCVDAEALVIAHLAQSLDGRIATHNGVSQFISGHEDLLHTHRLRALCDAVVVGSSTVVHDDPRLTTRLCSGHSPTRVVIDPRGRVGSDRRIMQDGPAPTVLIHREGTRAPPALASHVQVVTVVAAEGSWLSPVAILAALRARGLRRIFIEGGGVTVSRFLQAGLLDRLHVSVSPVIIGSGRPGFTLPEVLDLDDALRLEARCFEVGRDILFDCRLGAAEAEPQPPQ